MSRRFRPFRLGLWLGLLAALVYGARRFLQDQPSPAPADGRTPADRATPVPPRVVPPALAVDPSDVIEAGDEVVDAVQPGEPEGEAAGWVAPEGTSCPATHPIKAKLSSKIFHLPGMLAYERTQPDRCYADAASAEADGLRKAKR
jgi:hypothetical protein